MTELAELLDDYDSDLGGKASNRRLALGRGADFTELRYEHWPQEERPA